MSAARTVVGELASRLERHFGAELLGLYLFGSLAAGGFEEGRSDVDLLAVLRSSVTPEQLPPLEALHAAFVVDHPDWVERIEVGYMSRNVLQTLAGEPAGTIAGVSPGEPLNVKETTADWTLNWHGAVAAGQAIVGPPPLELGPIVDAGAFRRAVAAQLEAWQRDARGPTVKYVPVQQAYIVLTLCRALHALATGEAASKQGAAAWTVERYPQWAELVTEALATYRTDLDVRQRALLRFVDFAAAEDAHAGGGSRTPTP